MVTIQAGRRSSSEPALAVAMLASRTRSCFRASRGAGESRGDRDHAQDHRQRAGSIPSPQAGTRRPAPTPAALGRRPPSRQTGPSRRSPRAAGRGKSARRRGRSRRRGSTMRASAASCLPVSPGDARRPGEDFQPGCGTSRLPRFRPASTHLVPVASNLRMRAVPARRAQGRTRVEIGRPGLVPGNTRSAVTRAPSAARSAQPSTLVPQPAQKWALAGSSAPHSVQCWTAGASCWPQPMQNRAPAGLGAWQDAHTGPD